MQAGLVPSTARPRLSPPCAPQPDPGARRLQGGGVAEVGTTGALEKVAADRGHVADLRARREEEGLGHHRKPFGDDRMRRKLGHGGERTDAQPLSLGHDAAELLGEGAGSTRQSGRSTSSLRRSTTVVPPATKTAASDARVIS